MYNDANSVPIFCLPRAVNYSYPNRVSGVLIKLLPAMISMIDDTLMTMLFTLENPFQTDN